MLRSCLVVITVLISLTHACPHGWVENNAVCYFFSTRAASWSDAGSYCRNFNAKLAEPRTAGDVAVVVEALKHTHPSIGEYFLGGTDFFVEGEWVWASTIEPITNANWSPGEPNDQAAHEDCLGMVMSGLWNDVPCNISLPFVCELENDFGQFTLG